MSVTPDNILEIWESEGRPKANQAFADELGITKPEMVHWLRKRVKERGCDTIKEYRKRYPPEDYSKNKTALTETGHGVTAYSHGQLITTFDQLLNVCQVDREIWKIDRKKSNAWQVAMKQPDGSSRKTQLVQLTAWLVRRQPQHTYQAIEEMIAEYKSKPSPYRKIKPIKPSGDHVAVVAPVDVHFGAETGETLEEQGDAFNRMSDRICSELLNTSYDLAQIILPVGNDVLHADTIARTTTKGTQVETNSDVRYMLRKARHCYVYLVERLAEVAQVLVVSVESNHDRFAGFALNEILDTKFEGHPNVTVDCEIEPRKYHQYGINMLGFDHGDNVKPQAIPALMAMESPHIWADTTHRIMFRGHIHQSVGMHYPANNGQGVTIRVLPAFCKPDRWSVLKGFIGSHSAAEIMYFDRERGPRGSAIVFRS